MDFFFKNNYENKPDEELIALMVKGKERAFNEIYNRYSKKLFYFFYQKLYQDHNKAEDFLQDLFLKLIEKAYLFDTSKVFSTWFYTIAYNMCKNEYRQNTNIVFTRENNVKNLELSQVTYSTAPGDYDTNVFNKFLAKELSKLNEDQRATFILRHQENLTIKAIGEIMNCSEGTVKSRLFYAIEKLSKKLNAFDPIKTD
ncbi:RNA polymerase sigma factor [Flavobacteriaceae bacterium XHP0103]|uniref:RNA polymerase sigma factor n=1 Tax=Marixanthotalea marina TaxID=2844359 RepID=UPI002989B089|nr:RNA polymerase sigma factor [Marixanthotalea marina]MBU3820614.1 RNA polymerase sigma factor [Marixanthotalea marina]